MHKSINRISRWLHLYVSMASFVIIFFFSLTGITLNHTEWFEHQQKTVTIKDSVSAKWVHVEDTLHIAKLEIVEALRNKHKISGALSEFAIDEYQCTVSFTGPGYVADVFINREDGTYELTETKTGFWGVMNDLHKGRDTGKIWKLLIDITAVIMILISISGLFILVYLKNKRMAGFVVAIVGGLLSWLLYKIFVP